MQALERLDAEGDPHAQVAVFEAVMWRTEPREYWVWYRMSRVYAELGRSDMGFVCAARAAQIHPDWDATSTPYRDLYLHFRGSGDAASAAAVARQQQRHAPDRPVADAAEIDALFNSLGLEPRTRTAAPEHDAVLERLAAIIRATFGQPRIRIGAETTADDVPGWDSLSHARLLLAIEQDFAIRLEAREYLELADVGAIAKLIARRLAGARGSDTRRKLIVWGNCQAGALGVVLANTPAVAAHHQVVTHDVWARGDTLARDLADFEDADVLLAQDLRNWRDHPRQGSLPAGLRVLRFPFCYMQALWPFDAMVAGADEAMLRAMRAAEAAGEAFAFGFQDGLLARLREQVPDPHERFRRYRDFDFAGAPDLSRLAELDQARLLADDARLGCGIGRYIADTFRRVRLFHAIAHPTTGLIQRLAAELLSTLGIDPGKTGVASYDDYMGQYQVPLHPRVIHSLGLEWAAADTRYNFHGNEQLTFEQYARRYIALGG